MAPDGGVRLRTPFHKRGLRLPLGSAPKLTSAAGLGEVPTAARQLPRPRDLPPRHPPPPLHPGLPAVNCTPERVGVTEPELSDLFKDNNFKEGRG